MDKRQTAGLLAEASMVDNRVVTAETVEVWHKAIGHLVYEDAREALTAHRRDSTEYLQPAHITAGVRLIAGRRAREERVARPALEQRAITLDRAEFDRLTAAFTEQYRRGRADG